MAEEKIHMLHGAIGSDGDWSMAQERLEREGLLTVTHDLYGYLTEKESGFEQFSASFINKVEAIGKKDVKHHLLGYSLGGRLALQALLAQPSLWQSAIIISTHTGFPKFDTAAREDRLQSDRAWAEMAQNPDLLWPDFLSKWNNQGVLKSAVKEDLKWSDRLDLVGVRNEISNSFRAWSLGLQDDLLEQMSALTMPILWIVGGDDTKFLEIAKKAVLALPNAKLQIVKSAGHRVPWEQPNEFHSLVNEWFADFM